MTILYIALGLLLVAGLGSFLAFRLAFGRGRGPFEVLPRRRRRKTPWDAYQKEIDAGMAQIEALPFEAVSMTSFDGLRLRARLIPAENAARTVLCAHGYHGSGPRDFSMAVPFFHGAGCNVLLLDQRAQGRSEGRYITFGAREGRDCRDWAFWLAERMGPGHPIFLDGVSMGCTSVLLAVGLGLPGSVRGVIADCGYTRPWEMLDCALRRNFRVPGLFVRPLLWLMELWCRALGGFSLFEADTTEALRRAEVPILFAHGTGDKLVPCAMTERNYAACAGPKELLLAEGANHGLSYPARPEEYREKVWKLFGM